VARAGLMPALLRHFLPDNVQVEIFTPTYFPLKEMAKLLVTAQ